MKTGDRVLVRAGGAGVHFGTLVARSGQETHLKNSRRLWSWKGALSLSEVVATGVDLKNSKISESVEEVILPTTLEVLKISSKSNLPV